MSSGSIIYNSKPYTINPETGYLDYDDIEKTAKGYYPKLIVGGSSAYTFKKNM